MIIFILLLLRPHSFPFPNLIDKVSNFGYLLYRPSAKSRHWLTTSNDKDSRNCCDRYVCEIDLRFLWNSHFRFAIYPCELQLFWAIITCPLLTDEVFHFCAPACWDALERTPYLRKYVTIELKHLLVTWLFKRAFCKNILMLAGCKFFLHCIMCELIKDDCARCIFRFIYPCIGISAGFFRSNICALYEEGISKNWNLPAFNFFLFFFFKALFFLISD